MSSNSIHNVHDDGLGESNNHSTRSCGTAISGQSVSTSGGIGSPSSRSEQTTTVASSASDSTLVRLNNLDIQGDDAGSQGALGVKKKKRGKRVFGPDESGRGVRQFSMKVCEKVKSKGKTNFNEVADELVAEYSLPNNDGTSSDQQQYDEKNIRRRVYDALNVLTGMDIITKDKKEIQWKGLPQKSLSHTDKLKAEILSLQNRIEKKTAYSQELREQCVGLENLIQRNEDEYNSGTALKSGVALPFILLNTCSDATVEVEISDDKQLVHFDFNSTPFELHDENFVIKSMKLCDQPPLNNSQVPENHNKGSSTGPAPSQPEDKKPEK